MEITNRENSHFGTCELIEHGTKRNIQEWERIKSGFKHEFQNETPSAESHSDNRMKLHCIKTGKKLSRHVNTNKEQNDN